MLENMIVLFVIYIYIYFFPLLHSKLSTSLYTASVVFVLHPVLLLLLLYFIISHTYVCWVLLAVMCIILFLLFFSSFWVMLLGAERIRIESNRNWNRTENNKIGVDFSQFISISNVDSIGCLVVWLYMCVFYRNVFFCFFERDYYYCICYFFSSTAFSMWYGTKNKKLHPIVISESCAFLAEKPGPKNDNTNGKSLFHLMKNW